MVRKGRESAARSAPEYKGVPFRYRMSAIHVRPLVGPPRGVYPHVGERIIKLFDGVEYEGTVKRMDTVIDDDGESVLRYFIKYDDGDSEHLDDAEVVAGIALYKESRVQSSSADSDGSSASTSAAPISPRGNHIRKNRNPKQAAFGAKCDCE